MTSRPKLLSNTARAVEELRALIFAGDLPAGSEHLETELALRLGMSRTPVREAALTLQAQGLVAVKPRKGIRILPISIADMAEIYDVLTALEAMAAQDAAIKGYGAQDLAVLARTIADMDAALEKEDRAAWADADDRFHTELVRLGGNSRVMSIVALMADQVRRVRVVTLYLRPLPNQSNMDHSAVLSAIRVGDGALAAQVHTAHRKEAKEILIAILREKQLHSL